MKKKSLMVMYLLLIICYLLPAQTGTIRELTGEVELKPEGAADFTAAAVGSTVAQNTIVSTGFNSTAVIVVGSNTITVRPLTRLTLAEISSAANTETLNVNLQTGRVRVEVSPPAGTRARTQVQTPSATASVRGTDFEMDTVSLTVTEGNVLLMGNDGLNVPVGAGLSSSITDDGAAIETSVAAESELTPSSPTGTGKAGEDISSHAAAEAVTTGDLQVIITW